MLGDFITKGLVLLLGYVYPAFECFKTVEKNRADNQELRFWCQYWIIISIIAVFERIGDVFISWLPMYGEAKLAFIIYLWYPRTRGATYVYETILRPYVAQRETDIDRKLLEARAGALDMAVLYWKNIAEQGQTKFFEALRFFASQSNRAASVSSQKVQMKSPTPPEPEPRRHSPPSSRRQSPPPRLISRRSESQPPVANVKYELPAQTGTVEYNIIGNLSAVQTMKDQSNHETLRANRRKFWPTRRPDRNEDYP